MRRIVDEAAAHGLPDALEVDACGVGPHEPSVKRDFRVRDKIVRPRERRPVTTADPHARPADLKDRSVAEDVPAPAQLYARTSEAADVAAVKDDVLTIATQFERRLRAMRIGKAKIMELDVMHVLEDGKRLVKDGQPQIDLRETGRRNQVQSPRRTIQPPFARRVEFLQQVHCIVTALLGTPRSRTDAIAVRCSKRHDAIRRRRRDGGDA